MSHHPHTILFNDHMILFYFYQFFFGWGCHVPSLPSFLLHHHSTHNHRNPFIQYRKEEERTFKYLETRDFSTANRLLAAMHVLAIASPSILVALFLVVVTISWWRWRQNESHFAKATPLRTAASILRHIVESADFDSPCAMNELPRMLADTNPMDRARELARLCGLRPEELSIPSPASVDLHCHQLGLPTFLSMTRHLIWSAVTYSPRPSHRRVVLELIANPATENVSHSASLCVRWAPVDPQFAQLQASLEQRSSPTRLVHEVKKGTYSVTFGGNVPPGTFELSFSVAPQFLHRDLPLRLQIGGGTSESESSFPVPEVTWTSQRGPIVHVGRMGTQDSLTMNEDRCHWDTTQGFSTSDTTARSRTGSMSSGSLPLLSHGSVSSLGSYTRGLRTCLETAFPSIEETEREEGKEEEEEEGDDDDDDNDDKKEETEKEKNEDQVSNHEDVSGEGESTLSEFFPSPRSPTSDVPMRDALLCPEEISIVELIGRGTESTVYRVLRKGESLALKIQHSQKCGRWNSVVIALLNHPHLERLFAFGNLDDGRGYFLTEYVPGSTLQTILRERGKLHEETAIPLALCIASALGAVHATGLTHNDVKPGNIILADDGIPKLVDFGLAEPFECSSTGFTFMFAAPEVLSASNDPIDGRADLYSLGSVLYECVMGKPLFAAQSLAAVRELKLSTDISSHLTDLDKVISPAFAQIIRKLVMRNPSHRYRSAEELVDALANIDEINERIQRGESPSFVLDEPECIPILPSVLRERFVPRPDLFVRMEMLQQQAKITHHGQALVLRGEAGCGKTRLLQELRAKGEASGDKWYLFFACTRDPSAPPRDVIRQAFENLFHRLLRFSDGGKTFELLREVLAPFETEMKTLSRRLVELLKTGTMIHESSPRELLPFESGFEIWLTDALISMAHRRETIILIDDLQWVDESTRQVLAHLSTKIHDVPLALIAMMRTNPGRDEENSGFLSQVGLVSPLEVSTVDIEPFSESMVEECILNLLGGEHLSDSLVHHINGLCKGNVQAVAEIVRVMVDTGVLRFSFGEWLLNTASLVEMDIPGDIMQLCMLRLKNLTPACRRALEVGAALGMSFLATHVIQVCKDMEGQQVIAALREAHDMALVETGQDGVVSFIHDKLRDTLLTQLGKAALLDIHRSIAQALDSEQIEESPLLNMVARHYALSKDKSLAPRIYETNVLAGRKAYESFCGTMALQFLRHAVRIAESAKIQAHPKDLMLLADCCMDHCQYEEGLRCIQKALPFLKRGRDRSRLYGERAVALTACLRADEAMECIRKAFEDVDIPLPHSSRREILVAGLSVLRTLVCSLVLPSRISSWFHRRVYKADPTHKTHYQHACFLYSILAQLSYHNFDLPTAAESLMLLHHYSQFLDPSSTRADFDSIFAIFLAYIPFGSRVSQYFLQRAYQMADECGDGSTKLKAMIRRGIVLDIAGDSLGSDRTLRLAIDSISTSIVSQHAVLPGLLVLISQMITRGHISDTLSYLKAYARTGSSPETVCIFESAQMSLLALRGDEDDASELFHRPLLAENSIFPLTIQLGHRIFTWSLICDPVSDAEVVEFLVDQFKSLGVAPVASVEGMHHIYVAICYARILQVAAFDMRVSRGGVVTEEMVCRREILEREIVQGVHDLEICALSRPVKGHLAVGQAAVHRLRGDFQTADQYLHEGLTIGNETDSPMVVIMVNVERARALRAQGLTASAMLHATAGEVMAIQEGLNGLADRIVREFFPNQMERRNSHSRSSPLGPKARPRNLGATDKVERQFLALRQVSLASASVVDLERKVRVAIDEVIAILGAERGFLFLYKEDEPQGGGELHFRVGRNAGKRDIPLSSYSSSVVKQVCRSRHPAVINAEGDETFSPTESIVSHNLRSIIAAPLFLKEDLFGVLYVDSRLVRGAFSDEDLDMLYAIGNHIPIAIEAAKAIRIEVERRALKQARDDALESLQRRSQLLANVSHEIRSNMHGIMGITEVLQATELTAQQRDFVSTIQSGAVSLVRVINDILDFSKIEAGKMHLEETDFDLYQTVEDALELLVERAESKNLQLNFCINLNVPIALRGDKYRLRQVLTNFVTNAVKFTEKGEVSVVVSLDRETHRSVMLRFSVRDTGMGIPEEKLRSLFIPYSQVDHDEKDLKAMGTGLGLHISRQLVELMHGRLGVTSSTGKGSMFWFTAELRRVPRDLRAGALSHTPSPTTPTPSMMVSPEMVSGGGVTPRPPPITPQFTHSPEVEDCGLEGKRVLVHETNRISRQNLVNILRLGGMEITTSPSLEGVTESLRTAAESSCPFHAVIIECTPSMDSDSNVLREFAEVSRTTAQFVIRPWTSRRELTNNTNNGTQEIWNIWRPIRKKHVLESLVDALCPISKPPTENLENIKTSFDVPETRTTYRILLVDDNAMNLKVGKGLLSQLPGLEIIECSDGLEAVEETKKGGISVVLMDLQMPRMNGYEALIAIRAWEKETHQPHSVHIIAFSANAIVGERERCMAMGFDDFLSKPVGRAGLKSALEVTLGPL